MIVNPMAANGRTARQWPEIARRAEAHGLDVDVRLTERRGHATQLAGAAVAGGAGLGGSVGGDGPGSGGANGMAGGTPPHPPRGARGARGGVLHPPRPPPEGAP